MLSIIWAILIFGGILTLAYQSASLSVWTSTTVFLLLLYTLVGHSSWFGLFSLWLVAALVLLPFNVPHIRKRWLSRFLLNLYRQHQPKMSRTEKEALEAGTVGWEGDLFSGNPAWDKLLSIPKPTFTDEEQAFFDGPVAELCRMLDDWDIVHERADLPPPVWKFLKDKGFFGLNMPKQYGGKEFSAVLQSAIVVKLASISATAATTVAVPNSLGPAELLVHYGTTEQKDYYLPRLARGEEMPCFALTGPQAGSDAGAMPDVGIVCKGMWEGKEIIGIRVSWDKRYITLAPVATVLALAFKLHDPNHLIGTVENIGITCALIPTKTHGVVIGRRHSPLGIAFLNGPTQGKNVFIPLDWIIGGSAMAGRGWQMLMECLSAGRGISLPSISTGVSKSATAASGAYAQIRHQFNRPIGHFEAVEEALTRMAGYTYIMDATRLLTLSQIDQGEKPSVASAISKYHVTELGRKVIIDAMDIHGGKGICMGPRNYLALNYESSPVSITVEGANILTRGMIIFGQGVIRCHPYVLTEMLAAKNENADEALTQFDDVFWKHLAFIITNKARAILLALTNGKLATAPAAASSVKPYFQQLTRFSAAFALLSDVSLFTLGAKLKNKEKLSARLGDILSLLYMNSGVLKQFADKNYPVAELPLVEWSCHYLLHQIQEQMDGLLRNFPSRILAFVLRAMVFPWGRRLRAPSDNLGHSLARIILEPCPARSALIAGAYLDADPNNPVGLMEATLVQVVAALPLEKKLQKLSKEAHSADKPLKEQIHFALSNQSITPEEAEQLLSVDAARQRVIAVDDFASDELMHRSAPPAEVTAMKTAVY